MPLFLSLSELLPLRAGNWEALRLVMGSASQDQAVSDRLRVRGWMRRIEDLTRGTKEPLSRALVVPSGHWAQLFTCGLRPQAQPTASQPNATIHCAMVPRLSDLQAQLRKGLKRKAFLGTSCGR